MNRIQAQEAVKLLQEGNVLEALDLLSDISNDAAILRAKHTIAIEQLNSAQITTQEFVKTVSQIAFSSITLASFLNTTQE